MSGINGHLIIDPRPDSQVRNFYISDKRELSIQERDFAIYRNQMYFSLILVLHSLNKNTLNCTHARCILIKLGNAPMCSKRGIPFRHRYMPIYIYIYIK